MTADTMNPPDCNAPDEPVEPPKGGDPAEQVASLERVVRGMAARQLSRGPQPAGNGDCAQDAPTSSRRTGADDQGTHADSVAHGPGKSGLCPKRRTALCGRARELEARIREDLRWQLRQEHPPGCLPSSGRPESRHRPAGSAGERRLCRRRPLGSRDSGAQQARGRTGRAGAGRDSCRTGEHALRSCPARGGGARYVGAGRGRRHVSAGLILLVRRSGYASRVDILHTASARKNAILHLSSTPRKNTLVHPKEPKELTMSQGSPLLDENG